MAAASIRLKGKDLVSFKLGANATTIEGSSTDYVSLIRSISIEPDPETQENRALTDAFRYPIHVLDSYRITFTLLQVTHPALYALKNTSITWYLRTGAAAPATLAGTYFNGVALLQIGGVRIDNAPQELTFTLQGQSVLNVAAA